MSLTPSSITVGMILEEMNRILGASAIGYTPETDRLIAAAEEFESRAMAPHRSFDERTHILICATWLRDMAGDEDLRP